MRETFGDLEAILSPITYQVGYIEFYGIRLGVGGSRRSQTESSWLGNGPNETAVNRSGKGETGKDPRLLPGTN